MNFIFFINNVLLGAGLAMDAFSVSIGNGLSCPDMSRGKKILIPGTFSFFQFLMPVTGWFFVRFASDFSESFHRCIPWIALVLLLYIGGSMLIEGIRDNKEQGEENDGKKVPRDGRLTMRRLFIQGIATSIDAFSVGFTIADYNGAMALAAALIIAVVTFVICAVGVWIGETLGDIVGSRASILGGVILIGIGLEIFISHFL